LENAVNLRLLKERSLALGNHCKMSLIQGEAQFGVVRPPTRLPRAVSAGGTLSFEESEFLMQLGDCLRGMRGLREMSRRELARRSGVSERYIAQIEAGRGNVSIVLLLRIAQAIRRRAE
jgi:DNA-binding XRE family transcriptional regulator